jgi:hypothetical protein
MPTINELLRAILAPVLVSVAIAAIGRLRKWAWAMPLAAGAGFMTGYALLGLPRLPPRDGTDWLFWLTVPVTLLGVADGIFPRRGGWIMGAAAGAVALVIAWPLLTPHSIAPAELWATALSLTAAGAALAWIVGLAEPRIGAAAVIAIFCITIGGAALVVLSSNLRVVGIDGIAAAAALAPVAALAGTQRAGRGVAIVATAILSGLLVGGHDYPDPGVTWTQCLILMACPALMLPGMLLPGKRRWVHGIILIVVVALTVAAVAVPAALTAKKAAEADPYDAYK